MKRNEACDLGIALQYCDLARLDFRNAGLFYYHAACIMDNAIEKYKLSKVLENLSVDGINKLAFAYEYLASNPVVKNELTSESKTITNAPCYLRAAEKLKDRAAKKLEMPALNSSRFEFAGKSEQNPSSTSQEQPYVRK